MAESRSAAGATGSPALELAEEMGILSAADKARQQLQTT
jgi:hypothetical protein